MSILSPLGVTLRLSSLRHFPWICAGLACPWLEIIPFATLTNRDRQYMLEAVPELALHIPYEMG